MSCFYSRGDVVWYQADDESDIRQMLERQFGRVCKEHGGDGDQPGEVWAYYTYRKPDGVIHPCFRCGQMDDSPGCPTLHTLEQAAYFRGKPLKPRRPAKGEESDGT